MKLLILSDVPWNNSNSFGSSFSNIFGGSPEYTIAHIYCKSGLPDSKTASFFFQITEKNIIKSIVSKISSGKEVFSGDAKQKSDTWITKELKILRWQIFFWGRDLIWATGKWKSVALKKFIIDFNPDIIFLPIFYSSYLNNIGLYIKQLTGRPMVGYISDDCYTLNQFSLSPLFWIDRIIKRRYVKKSIGHCKVLFTITETQKQEYNAIFENKCQVLYKGGSFSSFRHRKTELNNPLKFIYTGNIYAGRWKTLALIGDALAKSSGKGVLLVYSTTPLSKKDMRCLTASPAVRFMGGIPSTEVKKIQLDADVLVHVESFELKERYKARLSFSTKIVDYMEAGRCILAVGWKETGAIEYLSQYDGAVVITDRKKINSEIQNLVNDPSRILSYGDKGFDLGKRFHQIDKIRTELYSTLQMVSENNL